MVKSVVLITLCLIIISPFLIGQGLIISDEAADIDESAILHLESSDKGFLVPRMTTNERDLIASPAEGLTIYNLDLNCIQINIGNSVIPSWTCADGSNCIPEVSQSNAGPDQIGVAGTQTNLNSSAPIGNETGLWEVISGTDGEFVDENDNQTLFTGNSGETYTLLWTISNPCGSTSDEVVISFQ